jgi:chromosome segregation ATPase
MSLNPATQAQIDQLQHQVERLNGRIKEARAEHAKADSAHQKLQEEVRQAKRRAESDRQDIAKLKPKAARMKKQHRKLNDYTEQVDQAVAKSMQVAASAAAIQNVNTARSLARAVQELHSGHAHQRALQNVGETDTTLQKSLRKMQDDIAKDSSEIKTLEQRIEDKQHGISRYVSRKQELSGQIASYQGQVQQLQNQIKQLQQA